MRRKLITVLLFVLPLTGISQKIFPVMWEARAVQSSYDTYDIILTCRMDSGYTIYEPNKTKVCNYSPRVMLEKSKSWSLLEELEVISYGTKYNRARCSNYVEMSICNLDRYEDSLVCIMTVKKLTNAPKISYVHGKILYYAMKANHGVKDPVRFTEVEFTTPLVEENIALKYPK